MRVRGAYLEGHADIMVIMEKKMETTIVFSV